MDSGRAPHEVGNGVDYVSGSVAESFKVIWTFTNRRHLCRHLVVVPLNR
jgi:hypothetical protein